MQNQRVVDNRLIGETAENIFLSLVNQRGVLAASFDTVGLDGVIFDSQHTLFKKGPSPFYVQIKCRGSDHEHFNPQGFDQTTMDRIQSVAKDLGIVADSLYFVVGFFKQRDIRTVRYYAIPFSSLWRFKTRKGHQYRFSVEVCETAMREDKNVINL